MTGYTIEVGYNSAQGGEEVWDKLKTVAKGICKKPEQIAEEAIKFGAGQRCNKDSLMEYAEAYKECGEKGTADLTVRIIEGEEPYISQSASGGGEAREIKEHLRRAFCRLVLYEMHKSLMEINIRVA